VTNSTDLATFYFSFLLWMYVSIRIYVVDFFAKKHWGYIRSLCLLQQFVNTRKNSPLGYFYPVGQNEKLVHAATKGENERAIVHKIYEQSRPVKAQHVSYSQRQIGWTKNFDRCRRENSQKDE
jgi:hypothetical protein